MNHEAISSKCHYRIDCAGARVGGRLRARLTRTSRRNPVTDVAPERGRRTGGCLATLSFTDGTGVPVGPSTNVSVNAGQIAFLDLPGYTVAKAFGQRAEVVPLLTPVAGTFCDGSAGAEVFDVLTGFDHVIRAPGPGGRPPNPNFSAIGIGQDQTLRLKALAINGDVCQATLSFTDANGNPVGLVQRLSLSPAQGGWLDLNGGTLVGRFGQRAEVTPIATVVTGTCDFVGDAFEQVTGATLVTHPPNPN
jgi:hypothetical protein